MIQIRDAPWIRDAEMNGYGDPPVECPICGEDCESIYLDGDRNVCGCEKCMKIIDSWDWMREEIERSRPDDY